MGDRYQMDIERLSQLQDIIDKFNAANTADQRTILQEIIDFIAAKDNKSANNKLLEISEKLDDFLDHTDEDEDLIEISKYQVLINQLFQKINPEEEGE